MARLFFLPIQKFFIICIVCPFFFLSCMLTAVEMTQASTDPFQCDRHPDNLNNFFDDSLNDIVDQGIVASNSQMFSVNSPHMSTESIKIMMPESKRNYFTCLCLNICSLGNLKNFNNFVLLLKSLPTSPIFLGITKTWLKKGRQGPHLCLPYYSFYLINRSKTERGSIGAYVLQTKLTESETTFLNSKKAYLNLFSLN